MLLNFRTYFESISSYQISQCEIEYRLWNKNEYHRGSRVKEFASMAARKLLYGANIGLVGYEVGKKCYEPHEAKIQTGTEKVIGRVDNFQVHICTYMPSSTYMPSHPQKFLHFVDISHSKPWPNQSFTSEYVYVHTNFLCHLNYARTKLCKRLSLSLYFHARTALSITSTCKSTGN